MDQKKIKATILANRQVINVAGLEQAAGVPARSLMDFVNGKRPGIASQHVPALVEQLKKLSGSIQSFGDKLTGASAYLQSFVILETEIQASIKYEIERLSSGRHTVQFYLRGREFGTDEMLRPLSLVVFESGVACITWCDTPGISQYTDKMSTYGLINTLEVLEGLKPEDGFSHDDHLRSAFDANHADRN